jgi:hypothetical protein
VGRPAMEICFVERGCCFSDNKSHPDPPVQLRRYVRKGFRRLTSGPAEGWQQSERRLQTILPASEEPGVKAGTAIGVEDGPAGPDNRPGHRVFLDAARSGWPRGDHGSGMVGRPRVGVWIGPPPLGGQILASGRLDPRA